MLFPPTEAAENCFEVREEDGLKASSTTQINRERGELWRLGLTKTLTRGG